MQQDYKDNPKRIVYNIDFDGTLTDGHSYINLIPNQAVIAKVQELYFLGNIILIWSARLWENAPLIASWCIKYGVPFHGLMLGKGGTDVYVDDKAISDKTFIGEN